jgi:UDP-N-acetylmuramyl pentapeptide phosphotransferase/UDP-N-acetylglucosamine-1-phosphate transferase
MEFLLLSIILFFLMLGYFKIANKYNIIDKPNHRSAHTIPTLRGGGIVYWLCFLIYYVQNPTLNHWFFVGITLVALVSFVDDIKSLPNKIRILAQFTAIALVFWTLNMFNLLPFWLVLIAFILFIGIINAYNFMDGINGITGLYTISVLISLLYIQIKVIDFTDRNLIIYPIIASLVFLFFNFRKKAKCFAGDIGSISIAFWVVFLLLQLMLKTQSVIWILFLLVYGIDTVCTIIHRLCLRENIFLAHRHHYYQILCNDLKIDHRIVATIYAFLQILVSVFVIHFYKKTNDLNLFLMIVTPFIFVYLTKFLILRHLKKS